MESASPSDIVYSPQQHMLPATELMPLPGCKSQFWRYFGFYSHNGQIIESMKRVVVCKLCLREMAYSGNTSNLSSHLNSRHPREFAAAKALAHVDRSTTRYVTSSNSPTASNSSAPLPGPTSEASFFKLPLKTGDALSVKRESFGGAPELEVSTNSPSNSLSTSGAASVLSSHALCSPAEEALMATAIDLLVSPRALLTSAPFLDFCQQLDANFSPPAHLSPAGLYQRVRDAVFPPEQRLAEAAFFALSIELDHLLHGRHGTATAQRLILHRLDAEFACTRVTLQSTLSQLHADPLSWTPHIRAVLADWELPAAGLVGVVLAGTWIEGAEAACLDNIRSRLPPPHFLSLEASLARVIAAAVDATNGREFVTSAICAMNADAKSDAAPHQDNALPEWCRLGHYLRDGPLASIGAGRVLLAFMAPLEAVYRQLKNEERVHLSVVRPLVALMLRQLSEAGGPQVDDQDWDGLRSRWCDALRDEFCPDDGYLVATLLDPRFKSLPFVTEAEKKVFHEQLQKKAFEEAANVYPMAPPLPCEVDAGGSSAKKARTSTELLLSELFNASGSSARSQKCPTTVEDKAEREISNYLLEEDLPLDGNPLAWWRSKKGQYPLLSLLARKYFCLPGLMANRSSFLKAQTRLPNMEESVRPMMTFLKEYQDWISVVREMG